MIKNPLTLSLLAAALAAAVPAAASAQPARQTEAARAAEVIRDVARAARTVSRYQGSRNQNRAEQREQQSCRLRVPQGGLLELRNIAGDITVTAGSGDTATVEITKIAHGPTDADARAQLALVKVECSDAGNRAEVRAVYPERNARGGRRNISVTTAYRVTAPAGARVKTDTISGNVAVTGIRGELTLGTISGDLTVRDGGQRITGQSISGNVELVSAQSDALVELSSTSGNVRANRVKVRRLDLGSISGSVSGSDIQAEQAELHTMSGNVEYSGALVPGGRYEFRTHAGDVRLTTTGSTGFELEASTFSGEIRSGLQLRMAGEVSRRSRTIRGTYGDARARIEASSFSGNIVINGR